MVSFNLDAQSLGNIVMAIGGLGIAASGLYDALKTLPWGGVSRIGFGYIRERLLDPLELSTASTGLPVRQILHGNWVNGMELVSQKAVAKSLLKLQLEANNAAVFAKATGVDSQTLTTIATNLQAGRPIAPDPLPTDTDAIKVDRENKSNVYGRFDLALTAIIDGVYNRADQFYRNIAKLGSGVIAVIIAIVVGWHETNIGLYVLCGLLAVPLAPVTKDLASAIQAGTKLAQAIKR